MTRTSVPLVAAAAVLFTIGCGVGSEGRSERDFGDLERVAGAPLKIATWNLEWLNRDNGAGLVPRSNADYHKLAEYADLLDADIIAVQEVDGAAAALRVFDSSVYNVHMSSRNNVQRTGFVYRKGLEITVYPDYTALDVGSLRYGTDIEVSAGDQSLRLLNVHLKSGCFSGSLNSGTNACNKLKAQRGPLESWIDARASEGAPFMVLGDFNRRLFSTSNDAFWTAIDDGNPAGADLSSPTQTGSAQCNNGQYPEFIDHLVTGSLGTDMVVAGSFDQQLYSGGDASNYDLSDHCPLSVEVDLGADPGGPGGGPSCAGACGGQAPGGCWCDDLCEQFGNCCDDKVAVCGGAAPDPNSCQGACGGKSPGDCWCDSLCANYGDCCTDKVALCG